MEGISCALPLGSFRQRSIIWVSTLNASWKFPLFKCFFWFCLKPTIHVWSWDPFCRNNYNIWTFFFSRHAFEHSIYVFWCVGLEKLIRSIRKKKRRFASFSLVFFFPMVSRLFPRLCIAILFIEVGDLYNAFIFQFDLLNVNFSAIFRMRSPLSGVWAVCIRALQCLYQWIRPLRKMCQVFVLFMGRLRLA